MKFTQEKKDIVNAYIKGLQGMDIAEAQLGLPIKVTVHWEEGHIVFQGSFAHKKIEIKSILDAYADQMLADKYGQ